MRSRRIKHAGQFALSRQSHIAEQSRRAMSELIQEITHSLFDLRPVLDPAMHLEDVLAQPAPQFLNGIEPGGIGRQPDWRDAWVLFQGAQDVRMRVNVPVIWDYINQSYLLRVRTIEAGIELAHLLAAHDVTIEIVDLSGQRIEGADGAPLLAIVDCCPPGERLSFLLPTWARPRASADSQTHPETRRPRCRGAVRRRADSGAVGAPCSRSLARD
jgi:hypothetical protein